MRSRTCWTAVMLLWPRKESDELLRLGWVVHAEEESCRRPPCGSGGAHGLSPTAVALSGFKGRVSAGSKGPHSHVTCEDDTAGVSLVRTASVRSVLMGCATIVQVSGRQYLVSAVRRVAVSHARFLTAQHACRATSHPLLQHSLPRQRLPRLSTVRRHSVHSTMSHRSYNIQWR
jgi:hypothetical protein